MQESINPSPVPSPEPHPAAERQTILLVEDEEMVRTLLCDVLERTGYRVLPCAHPQEGIDLCLKYSSTIDLLLTDIVLPGMSGPDMVTRIQRELPDLRVVFMSGYTEHALAKDGRLEPIEYLQKPFSLKTLRLKLNKVLRRPPTRIQ